MCGGLWGSPGTDQHPAPQVPGHLGQGQLGDLDVVGRGVGPGVARPEQDRQRFPGAVLAMVGERGQGWNLNVFFHVGARG